MEQICRSSNIGYERHPIRGVTQSIKRIQRELKTNDFFLQKKNTGARTSLSALLAASLVYWIYLHRSLEMTSTSEKTFKWIVQPDFEEIFRTSLAQVYSRKDSVLPTVSIIARLYIEAFKMQFWNPCTVSEFCFELQVTDSSKCNRLL